MRFLSMKIILPVSLLAFAIIFLLYSKREYEKAIQESEFVLDLQETILKENEVDRIYYEDLSKLLPQIKEEFDAYYYIHQGNIIIHQQKMHALNKKDTSKLLLIERLKVNNELINSMVQSLNQRDKIINKHTKSYQY